MEAWQYRTKLSEVIKSSQKYLSMLDPSQHKYYSKLINYFVDAGDYLMAYLTIIESLPCVAEKRVSRFIYDGIYTVSINGKSQIVRTEVLRGLVCDCDLYKESSKLHKIGRCPHVIAVTLFQKGQES